MAGELPEVEDTGPDAFARLGPHRRNVLRERRLLMAEWAAPEGAAGRIVINLRARARVFEIRALWVFGSLILAVLAGLIFYVVIPVVTSSARTEANLYNQRLDAVSQAAGELAAERETYQQQVADGLREIWVFERASGSSPYDGYPTVLYSNSTDTYYAVDSTQAVLTSKDREEWDAITDQAVPDDTLQVYVSEGAVDEYLGKDGRIRLRRNLVSRRFTPARFKLDTDAFFYRLVIDPEIMQQFAVKDSALVIRRDNEALDAIRDSDSVPNLWAALEAVPREYQQHMDYEPLIRLEERQKQIDAEKALWETEIENARDRLAQLVPLTGNAGDEQWYKTLLERLPGAILLLFLLATLGGLYRYNLRMTGFYHARADALELLGLHLDRDQFDALATTLAAEKVEFKAAQTPADQASEMAKEMISKLDLKPKA